MRRAKYVLLLSKFLYILEITVAFCSIQQSHHGTHLELSVSTHGCQKENCCHGGFGSTLKLKFQQARHASRGLLN
jgi:hypothetical protein